MLQSHWDNVLEWFMKQGRAISSKLVLEVGENIKKVVPAVRDEVLSRLLDQNQKLASIACYKTRQIEFPEYCDVDECNLQIFKYQEQFIRALKNFTDPSCTITKEQRALANVPDETLEQLDLKDVDPNPKSPFIVSLTEIGWLDPFPDEGEDSLKEVNEYIDKLEDHDVETKRMESFALPTKSVMIKIMRACIGVSHPGRLWIN